MPGASTSLAHVTVSAPNRRVDIALPDHVPLAELFAEVLRHAGDGLADQGERHGGWLLRRADGTPLVPTGNLSGQGVRDGAVLHLVPARAQWPELEYDDVVEAIAEGARRHGLGWSPQATRVTGLVVAGLAFAMALAVVALSGSAPVALLVALVLLAGGAGASRAYGDSVLGVVLAMGGLPFAFAGGALLGDPARWRADALLAGCSAALLASILAAVAVAHGLRLFVAVATAALLGGLGALIAMRAGPHGAAAVVLAALVAGVAAVPLLAIRLGKLPMPALGLPASGSGSPGHPSGLDASGLRASGSSSAGSNGAGLHAFGLNPPGLNPAGLGSAGSHGPGPNPAGLDLPGSLNGSHLTPGRARVFAAVARTDEMLTGMLTGIAGVAAAASALLALGRLDASALGLIGVAATAFLLRARLFVTVRQRLPLLGAGVAGFVVLAAGLATRLHQPWTAPAGLVMAGTGLLVAVSAVRYATRSPSPYLGRAADLLDALCVVSVIPLACAVLGLYGLAKDLVT
jgi:type VII secretion integral membrane protein EccD